MVNFEDWLQDELDIEVAELGGMSDREAESFCDRRMEDESWVNSQRQRFSEIQANRY